MHRHCEEGWLLEALKACLNANHHLSHVKKESLAVKYIFISTLWASWHQKGINRSHLWSVFPLVLGDLLFFCLCEAISAFWIVLSISSRVPVCQYHPSLLYVWKGLESTTFLPEEDRMKLHFFNLFFTETAAIAAPRPQKSGKHRRQMLCCTLGCADSACAEILSQSMWTNLESEACSKCIYELFSISTVDTNNFSLSKIFSICE